MASISVAKFNSELHISWIELDFSYHETIYAARYNGSTITAPQKLDNQGAASPQLKAGQNKLFLMWHEDHTAYAEYEANSDWTVLENPFYEPDEWGQGHYNDGRQETFDIAGIYGVAAWVNIEDDVLYISQYKDPENQQQP